MAEKDDGKALRIEFDVPADFPTKYASNLVVQFTEHDFTVTFFDIRPPLLVGTAEEKASQVAAMEKVKAAPLARIVIAASRMPEFVRVMQDNLKTFEATVKERQATGDRA
jgi:hypothetical protein